MDENLWLDWSVPASFETGMKGEESWKADWIEAEDTFYQDGGEMNMSPCLYKECGNDPIDVHVSWQRSYRAA